MLTNFNRDLAKAKTAEQIALNVLSSYYDGWLLEDVSNDRECFYKGDIKAIYPCGNVQYIEVKDDSRIADTKNILCEECNYIKDGDYFIKGNMSGSGDLYVIVSQQERKLYILDYKRLREIYTKGDYKIIQHPQQVTYCYLLELCRAKQWGALIEVITY